MSKIGLKTTDFIWISKNRNKHPKERTEGHIQLYKCLCIPPGKTPHPNEKFNFLSLKLLRSLGCSLFFKSRIIILLLCKHFTSIFSILGQVKQTKRIMCSLLLNISFMVNFNL